MRSTRAGLVLGSALGIASALIVLLGLRLTDLRTALREAQRKVQLPYRGYVLPTFTAATITGDTATIGAVNDPQGRQVVLILTTTCPHCLATLPTWRQMVDSVRRTEGHRVPVVAISLDSIRATVDYAKAHRIDYPLVALMDWRLVQLLKARAVPQTLVVDERGVVLFAHTGRLGPGPSLDSLYAALRLPDASEGRSVSTGNDPAIYAGRLAWRP